MRLTVGEVRATPKGTRYKVVCLYDDKVAITLSDEREPVEWHRWYTQHAEADRIVEVAPENRAHVTAGPPWMRGAR